MAESVSLCDPDWAHVKFDVMFGAGDYRRRERVFVRRRFYWVFDLHPDEMHPRKRMTDLLGFKEFRLELNAD